MWEQGTLAYSITRSARASTVSGIVMPSAFAVRKLIDSSTCVGCWTGRSAGFTPVNIFHVFSSAMIHGSPWRPITHQGASICKLRDVCDGGESVFECQRGNGFTQVIEGGVGHDDQGLGSLARKSRKSSIEFSHGRELDQPNRHTHRAGLGRHRFG